MAVSPKIEDIFIVLRLDYNYLGIHLGTATVGTLHSLDGDLLRIGHLAVALIFRRCCFFIRREWRSEIGVTTSKCLPLSGVG